MSKKEELLPCPWCGKGASVEEYSQPMRGEIVFSCGCDTEECLGFQSLTSFDRRIDAIKAWNTRPTPPVTDEMVDRAALAFLNHPVENDPQADIMGKVHCSMKAALTEALKGEKGRENN